MARIGQSSVTAVILNFGGTAATESPWLQSTGPSETFLNSGLERSVIFPWRGPYSFRLIDFESFPPSHCAKYCMPRHTPSTGTSPRWVFGGTGALASPTQAAPPDQIMPFGFDCASIFSALAGDSSALR